MKKMKIWVFVMAVAVIGLFALSSVAMAGDTEPATKQDAPVFHMEQFVALGSEFGDGSHVTLAIDYQFGFGSKRWRFVPPDAKPQESNGPRVALLGIGIGGSERGLEARFPVITVRVVRNAWIGTAVTVPIVSGNHYGRTPGFSVTLSICNAKEWWQN